MSDSMTGYGTAEIQAEGWRCLVEIRSVNQRFLDIRLKLPSGYQSQEKVYREKIKGFCRRGKVECLVKIEPLDGENGWSLDEERMSEVNRLIQHFEKTSKNPLNLQLRDLMQLDVVKNQGTDLDPEAGIELIERCLESALLEFKKMKSQEGEALCKDLNQRRSTCSKMVNELEKETKDLAKIHFEKLQQRALDILNQVELQPERLNQELALLCDRYDVSEELLRLRTHLTHLETLLKEPELGKKGEFMLQEINREVNTLSSKSNNAVISKIAVEFKNELEKMREQLLNLE